MKRDDKKVSNLVISKIRDLINLRNFERNDKLPSERIMSEKLGFNRTQIRGAIRKLEYYGVLKTKSNIGTHLEIGLNGFNGMVDDIISLETPSFKEMIEVRRYLELNSVGLASKRRTDIDLKIIKDCLNAFKNKVIKGSDYLEEDLLFHLAIAKASKNNTLISLMLLLMPPILKVYERDVFCDLYLEKSEIEIHENIYFAIESKDQQLAEKMMNEHFSLLKRDK
ncbi:FCD domain-containing protein [Polaribacter sp. Z022]|uniref:FadR/GntR family transcriptional regulator n=1 Tax=Polaribacter sp. Z022 TaxID=2927125 RepID=UPI00202224F9|nr:FCD domain-containing protein [Polaribacter sp. Z022]MCL7752683.1 FCD domain-containing protein [Polaribacter sp. Z022]